MPRLTQGNIFDAAKRTELVVVFGHIGFNLMSMHWRHFAQRTPKLSDLVDPFRAMAWKEQQSIAWISGAHFDGGTKTASHLILEGRHEDLDDQLSALLRQL